MTKKQQLEPKPEPKVVQAAYKGIVDAFKLYVDPEGREYVRLPSGKRARVAARRDGTYVVEE